MDVTVVGAGLVGSALAAALARCDLEVTLMSDAPPAAAPEGWDARVYAISPGSRALLEELGAWKRLDASRVQAVTRMEIFGDDGQARLEFDARHAGVAELACITENAALSGALWQTLQADGRCALRVPARPASLRVEPGAARLGLDDGTHLDCALVAAADGRDSWVRSTAGIETTGHDYPQHAVVANFECTLPHGAAARQWFREDGVLALLPLPGRRVSMVWSATEPVAGELLHAAPDELAARVAAASGGRCGDLSVITPPAGFALRARLARRFVQPRLVLVGDAAHNVHPLAGQGVNLGFRDVRELAAVLAARGPQRDCGALPLLRRYERARREDALAMLALTDGLQRLFSSRLPGARRVRNAGLALTGRLPLVRRVLSQRALA